MAVEETGGYINEPRVYTCVVVQERKSKDPLHVWD